MMTAQQALFGDISAELGDFSVSEVATRLTDLGYRPKSIRSKERITLWVTPDGVRGVILPTNLRKRVTRSQMAVVVGSFNRSLSIEEFMSTDIGPERFSPPQRKHGSGTIRTVGNPATVLSFINRNDRLILSSQDIARGVRLTETQVDSALATLRRNGLVIDVLGRAKRHSALLGPAPTDPVEEAYIQAETRTTEKPQPITLDLEAPTTPIDLPALPITTIPGFVVAPDIQQGDVVTVDVAPVPIGAVSVDDKVSQIISDIAPNGFDPNLVDQTQIDIVVSRLHQVIHVLVGYAKRD